VCCLGSEKLELLNVGSLLSKVSEAGFSATNIMVFAYLEVGSCCNGCFCFFPLIANVDSRLLSPRMLVVILCTDSRIHFPSFANQSM
jgi:hypothetical protein